MYTYLFTYEFIFILGFFKGAYFVYHLVTSDWPQFLRMTLFVLCCDKLVWFSLNLSCPAQVAVIPVHYLYFHVYYLVLVA